MIAIWIKCYVRACFIVLFGGPSWVGRDCIYASTIFFSVFYEKCFFPEQTISTTVLLKPKVQLLDKTPLRALRTNLGKVWMYLYRTLSGIEVAELGQAAMRDRTLWHAAVAGIPASDAEGWWWWWWNVSFFEILRVIQTKLSLKFTQCS